MDVVGWWQGLALTGAYNLDIAITHIYKRTLNNRIILNPTEQRRLSGCTVSRHPSQLPSYISHNSVEDITRRSSELYDCVSYPVYPAPPPPTPTSVVTLPNITSNTRAAAAAAGEATTRVDADRHDDYNDDKKIPTVGKKRRSTLPPLYNANRNISTNQQPILPSLPSHLQTETSVANSTAAATTTVGYRRFTESSIFVAGPSRSPLQQHVPLARRLSQIDLITTDRPDLKRMLRLLDAKLDDECKQENYDGNAVVVDDGDDENYHDFDDGRDEGKDGEDEQKADDVEKEMDLPPMTPEPDWVREYGPDVHAAPCDSMGYRPKHCWCNRCQMMYSMHLNGDEALKNWGNYPCFQW